MNVTLKTIIWHQFGAAIDMLGDAIRACPAELWHFRLWDDPDGPEYSEFWFVAYHTLYWLDLYLSGGAEDFAPPDRFKRDRSSPNYPLPDEPYTQDEILTYLAYCRRKCQTTIAALTEETAYRRCRFVWGELSFLELLLYNMRHVQEHGAQFSLILGQSGDSATDWVPIARSENG